MSASRPPFRPAGGDLFRALAPRYDWANRIISLGRDRSWRRIPAKHLRPGHPQGTLLDAACGTGDQLLALLQGGCAYRSMTGLDCSEPMLEQARKKAVLMRYAIQWVRASADAMPFADQSFDTATMTFGLRNITDRPAALRELRRVLAPSGRLAIMEFSMPERGYLRMLIRAYLTTVLPWAGGAVTGQFQAYHYLAESILRFPRPDIIRAEMQTAGFPDVRIIPVDLGCVYLYLA